MNQRWAVLIAAVTASALFAGGLAVAVDAALTSAGPAPRLTTVSTVTLARAGYSLARAVTPPYCGIEEAAADRRWLPAAGGGCPISRPAAEEVASGAGANVIEAVLARVSSTTSPSIGQDRLGAWGGKTSAYRPALLAWMVVVHRHAIVLPLIMCAGPAADATCPPSAPLAALVVLVFVDARTAQPLAELPLHTTAPLPPGPSPPTPGRGPLPPVAASPATQPGGG
jgi:hypothetical protein